MKKKKSYDIVPLELRVIWWWVSYALGRESPVCIFLPDCFFNNKGSLYNLLIWLSTANIDYPLYNAAERFWKGSKFSFENILIS